LFVALTTLGCAVWALAFVLAGMLAGSAWGAVGSTLGRALLIAGVAVLLVSVAGFGRARVRNEL